MERVPIHPRSKMETPPRFVGEHVPSVVLIRDRTCFKTSVFLQRALETQCNLKAVPLTVPLTSLLRSPPRPRFRASVARKFLESELKWDPGLKRADLVLVVDPAPLHFVPSDFGATTAFYAIDSHWAFDIHRDESLVAGYDHVFVAQKDDVPKYREIGCRSVHWLPFGHDPAIHRRTGAARARGVVFVGNPQTGTPRGDAIRRMQAEAGLEVHAAFLHDMVRLTNEARVVFNHSWKGDLNMRVFEALGCGSLLLTDRIENGLRDLFDVGRELVAYDNVDEAVDLARHYVAADEEREVIAARGHAVALARHTYAHRTRDVLRIALGYDPGDPARTAM